jgi:hypothetical protein
MTRLKNIEQANQKRKQHVHAATMKQQEMFAGVHPLEQLLLDVKMRVRKDRLDGSQQAR